MHTDRWIPAVLLVSTLALSPDASGQEQEPIATFEGSAKEPSLGSQVATGDMTGDLRPRRQDRGSVSGVTPGFDLFGQHFPLNMDGHTFLVPVAEPVGQLDATGNGGTAFTIPKLSPSLDGTTIYHLYVVIDPQFALTAVGNALPTRLVK